MKISHHVLKVPVITEKTTMLRDEKNQYVFEVYPEANKIEIKKAVESVFNVKVLAVNTLIRRGKERRTMRLYGKRPNRKFAIVTLRQGDTISLHEGV